MGRIAPIVKSFTRWAWVILLVLSACVSIGSHPDRDVHDDTVESNIVINAPVGPPGPMAELLAQSVADALVRRGYVARSAVSGTADMDNADFYVTGTAEALSHSHAPTVAALHWVLYNGEKKEIAYLTQGVRGNPDSWEYGSPAMLRIVGEEAAADFSVFLGRPHSEPVAASASLAEMTSSDVSSIAPDAVEQPLGQINDDSGESYQPAETPVAQTPVPAPPSPPPLPKTSGKLTKQSFGLWLDEVSGAPGNGNAALTQAIYSELKRNELPFALSPRLASHYVQGVVDVVVRSATQEHVTIVWVVSNAAGEEVGRVTQRNDIARGSLHGEWGDTAVYAARGGLDGILAILERDLESSLQQ